jgi:hypothetical protein
MSVIKALGNWSDAKMPELYTWRVVFVEYAKDYRSPLDSLTDSLAGDRGFEFLLTDSESTEDTLIIEILSHLVKLGKAACQLQEIICTNRKK